MLLLRGVEEEGERVIIGQGSAMPSSYRAGFTFVLWDPMLLAE